MLLFLFARPSLVRIMTLYSLESSIAAIGRFKKADEERIPVKGLFFASNSGILFNGTYWSRAALQLPIRTLLWCSRMENEETRHEGRHEPLSND
jgi:hypothetical protein